MSDPSELDAREALKRVAKALARTLPITLLRTSAILLVFLVLNLVFTTYIFIYAGMGSHGPGGAVLFPLAAIPFAPFFIVALILAHKQGIAQLVAAVVESQARTLAVVGGRAVAAFIQDNKAQDPKGTPRTFGRAWQSYLKTRTSLPWPVRFVLSRIFARIAITEIVDTLAAEGVSEEDFPREFMTRVIQLAAQTFLRPTWKPVLILLLVNIVWFGAIFAKVRMT